MRHLTPEPSPPALRGALLKLVLFVSCAHALVHVYELSLPSVEQLIGADFATGKSISGWLGTTWRVPFGLCAFVAGMLVDRFGSRKMLTVYLFGCAAMYVVAAAAPALPALFVAMFGMGLFASIYHPAGLALLSHEIPPDELPKALGLHGIFGSAGIGGAPLLVGVLLSVGLSWRESFAALALPGALLGCIFLARLMKFGDVRGVRTLSAAEQASQDKAQWSCYFMLTAMAVCQGFVYSAVLNFLPRYIGGEHGDLGDVSNVGNDNLVASGVLLVGCFGQYAAGQFARGRILEQQLLAITLANIPFLLWMAVADGWQRVAAAGLWALLHFMHQPIYNSLIAKYTPRRRRSLCYGFSFAMGLGVGGMGAAVAGYAQGDGQTYCMIAAVAGVGSLLASGLIVLKNRPPTN